MDDKVESTRNNPEQSTKGGQTTAEGPSVSSGSAPLQISGSDAEIRGELLASLPEFNADHRKLLRVGTGILLSILAFEWIYLATQRPDPLPLERGDAFRSHFRIEINNATWVEWLQMEGIGPSLAHRIVADRKINGPFRSIEDVGRVPGIGPATLDRIRPWLTISHELSETQSTDADRTTGGIESVGSDHAR